MSRSRGHWLQAGLLIATLSALAAGADTAPDAAKPGSGAPLVPGYAIACPMPTLTAMESGVVDALNHGRAKRGQAVLEIDPALCLAAAAHVKQFVDGDELDPFADARGSVRYWLAAAGVSTVFVTSACAAVDGGSGPDAAAAALEPRLNADAMTHVGIGTVHVQDEVLISVIAAARHITLQPTPGRVEPGHTFRLAGRLHEPLTGARVVLACPDGAMTCVASVQGREIDVAVALGREAGEYRIDIVGLAEHGPMLTDVLRLHAGVPYPQPFAQQPPPPADAARQRPEPVSDADMAAELVSRINKLRLARGLKPLRTRSKLMQIAAYNSKELRDRDAREPNSAVADVYIKSQVRYKAYKVALFVGPRLPRARDMRLTQIELFTHVGVGISQGDMDGKAVMWGTVILVAK